MIQHKQLGSGRWKELSLFEQMANVGSEIERTIQWKAKGNEDYSRRAFERALELLDFTIEDDKNKKRLKEIVRVREALADHFYFDNEYQSTDAVWRNYFFCFNFAARVNR
jgi:hypothetical protein